MHITDELNQARRALTEAQARYEQALADHREAYPWLLIDDKSEQPGEGMADPANWQAGDWLKCSCRAPDLTSGKLYKVIAMDEDDDPVIDDDAERTARPSFCFRFHSRP